jgi:TRAP-type uncharacterized transport system substrate-binding protein
MSADVPAPAYQPPPRSQLVKNNRRQMLLFTVFTLVLSLATVWGGRILLKNSETLTFAVGDANGDDAHFAARLAAVLKSTNSRLRLKIVTAGDAAKAVSQFDRREADLMVLRTDSKIPPRARAIAILEHDVVLLLSPGSKKIKSFDDLKKVKKIAVWADGDNTASFVRNIFGFTDSPETAAKVQIAPPGSTLDKLFASGFGAVIAVAHTSKVMQDKSYEQLAKKGGFTLNAIDSAKALARKIPGISEETLSAGTISASPAIPDDDLDTIGLQWLLVAQSKMTLSTATDLARAIYENKSELALDDGFASKIEPAETDKDAFIIAHPGASEYINDDTKSFMDKYSDMMYLGAGALSVIGSLFAALYTKVTRVAPERAGELATELLTIGEKIERAYSLDELDELQDQIEAILRGVIIGLRDGSVSGEGLETFKLGYEFVRDDIAMRRDHLKRHGGDKATDENLAVVKTARSA